MGNLRGLRTRLCPTCKEVTPHRTLYAKTESGGRTKWLPMFWTCTKCNSLNHVTFPRYRLESASTRLPSTLTIAVVRALQEGSLDFGELVASLRRMEIQGFRHVFDSDVVMALEYLKGRGVVREEAGDRTAQTLGVLRKQLAESRQLRPCPAEMAQGVASKSLISLYCQRWISITRGGQGPTSRERRLVPAGELCIHCGCAEGDSSLSGMASAVIEIQAPVAVEPSR